MTTTTLQPLTDRQREVYSWIADFYRRERIPPSVREVQAAFGILSPNGVVCHLQPLERKGWIERRPNTARGILPTLEALAHES